MAELRRIVISDLRIKKAVYEENHISLNPQEIHYTSRVMRYRSGDYLHIVDGKGSIWLSQLITKDTIKLLSDFDKPILYEQKPSILLGLAVVVPRQGFDNLIRMSCELGIDYLQPLFSEHSILTDINEDRYRRWNTIINESLEQSERLWKPDLRKIATLKDWLDRHHSENISIATTRLDDSITIESFLNNLSGDIDRVWSLIGPEGGWSNSEIKLAKKQGCTNVKLGNFILRTSTASVAATHAMNSWRSDFI